MGVTSFEIKLLESVIDRYKPKSVIEFGSQTNYTTQETARPPFMSEWFVSRGLIYVCIDLAGDNEALQFNWSYPLMLGTLFGLVTDFGSGEHSAQKAEYISIPFHEGYINSVYPNGQPTKEEIELGFYNCWLNKHQLLEVGGIMVNANPLTGHWPEHGYSYLGENFYEELVKVAGYEIIESGINCATGNCETGKNVYSVLKKVSEKFPSFEMFSNLPIYKS